MLKNLYENEHTLLVVRAPTRALNLRKVDYVKDTVREEYAVWRMLAHAE